MSDHVDIVRYVMVITMCAFGGGGLFFSEDAVRDRGERREDAAFWIIDSEIARLEFAVWRLGFGHAAVVSTALPCISSEYRRNVTIRPPCHNSSACMMRFIIMRDDFFFI